MLDNMTVQRMHEMKLSVMAAKFQTNDNAVKGLDFEEHFGCLARPGAHRLPGNMQLLHAETKRTDR